MKNRWMIHPAARGNDGLSALLGAEWVAFLE